ncbi:MAG: hypothetical protein JXR10_10390 [Cyclobacteriaceae bacterium]
MNTQPYVDTDFVGFDPLESKRERAEECVFKKCCKKYKKKGRHCKKCPKL